MRAYDNLARLLEARLRIEEMAASELAASHRAMEASAQLIPVWCMPGALRRLLEVQEKLNATERSAAILRQKRLAVEGRRRAVARQLDIGEAHRDRKIQEAEILDSPLVVSKASGKHAMVK